MDSNGWECCFRKNETFSCGNGVYPLLLLTAIFLHVTCRKADIQICFHFRKKKKKFEITKFEFEIQFKIQFEKSTSDCFQFVFIVQFFLIFFFYLFPQWQKSLEMTKSVFGLLNSGCRIDANCVCAARDKWPT